MSSGKNKGKRGREEDAAPMETDDSSGSSSSGVGNANKRARTNGSESKVPPPAAASAAENKNAAAAASAAASPAAVAEYVSRVQVTKPAPGFTTDAVLADGSLGKVSLSDYRGKYVVLWSFPLAWTFVCPTEIIAFSRAVKRFEEANCAVLGWSVDSVYSLLAWRERAPKQGGIGSVAFPLLSDLRRSISRDYGVLLEDAGHTSRGLFIIDGKGVLRHASFNDPPVGRNIEEVLRLVTAYQYTDVHGTVCPINWSKEDNKATIKPDPKQSKEYFEKAYMEEDE